MNARSNFGASHGIAGGAHPITAADPVVGCSLIGGRPVTAGPTWARSIDSQAAISPLRRGSVSYRCSTSPIAAQVFRPWT
jgi:hypothetical protein